MITDYNHDFYPDLLTYELQLEHGGCFSLFFEVGPPRRAPRRAAGARPKNGPRKGKKGARSEAFASQSVGKVGKGSAALLVGRWAAAPCLCGLWFGACLVSLRSCGPNERLSRCTILCSRRQRAICRMKAMSSKSSRSAAACRTRA